MKNGLIFRVLGIFAFCILIGYLYWGMLEAIKIYL